MPNRLAQEGSPYLRQHADNPVDWYPWGPEALERAAREDKPIHLSVGYAACHWCHVMAHESFENPATAEFLNAHFVNIKVDRQERPDVDDIYQKVLQMRGQGGGWPLTVFLTPKGEPFFGGTYFPPGDAHGRPGFPRLIIALADAWKTRREDIQSNVEQFMKGYPLIDEQHLAGDTRPAGDLASEAAREFTEQTDVLHGGLGGAPKFPNPLCHDLMLRTWARNHDPQILAALELTLDAMSTRGLYDHLGGGFARYCVDEIWAVPHFEKMLYDNGLLVKLYADAFRATGHTRHRAVFEDAIAYVLRDLKHPEGGFFSSEDADSEGEEGKFYAWTPAQMHEILSSDDAAWACEFFGVTESGNFEHGTTVLARTRDLETSEIARWTQVRAKLFVAREKRPRPERDENILTSWNALMIQGLCAAYQATGTQAYLAAAQAAYAFIAKNLTRADGSLLRAWRDGRATTGGFLDDYAYLANALIDLYESSFEKRYLDRAIALVERILADFWDRGLFFTPKSGETLIHRPRAPHDNAWPSGVSTTAHALVRLHALTDRAEFASGAQELFATYGAAARRNAFGFAHLIAAQDFARHRSEVVLAGPRQSALSLASIVQRVYLPHRVLAHADDAAVGTGKTPQGNAATAYLCREQTCSAPITSAEVLAATLKGPS